MEEIEQRVRQSILRFLSYRLRSVQEVRDHLKSKDFSSPVVEKILQEFLETEMLDDRKFASWWVDSREHTGDRGPRAVIVELRAKGVPEEIITAAVARDWSAAAQVAVKKQIKRAHTAALTPHAKQVIINRLRQKGFTFQQIEQALSQNDRQEGLTDQDKAGTIPSEENIS